MAPHRYLAVYVSIWVFSIELRILLSVGLISSVAFDKAATSLLIESKSRLLILSNDLWFSSFS